MTTSTHTSPTSQARAKLAAQLEAFDALDQAAADLGHQIDQCTITGFFDMPAGMADTESETGRWLTRHIETVALACRYLGWEAPRITSNHRQVIAHSAEPAAFAAFTVQIVPYTHPHHFATHAASILDSLNEVQS